MTPLERAARALAMRHGKLQERSGATNLTPNAWADRRWTDYVDEARAVIAAIREPSEDMVEAGASHELGLALVAAWERMMDALLEEGK